MAATPSASTLPPCPSASQQRPPILPAMAAGKENETPAAPSTAVAARRHCLAVRRCGLKKRPGVKRGLCRVPFRDITNLVMATELEDPDQVTTLDAVVSPPTVGRDAVAAGMAVKAARYSLRKQFR